MKNIAKQLINSSGNYVIQICLTENSKINLVTDYIKEGLSRGEAIFVISKPKLRKILKLKMDGLSFDGQALQDKNQIRFFDAEFLILSLKFDEDLEEEIFQQNVVDLIATAQSNYERVRIFEEMANILWKQGWHDILTQFIGQWKNLVNTQKLCSLCTYSLDHLDPAMYEGALESIFRYHSHLTPQENYDPSDLGINEEALSIFESTWNRLIHKLSH